MSKKPNLLFDELKTASEQILITLSEIIRINTLFIAVNDSTNNIIVKSYNREEKLIEEGIRSFHDAYCSLVVQNKDGLLIIPETVSHPLTKTMNVTREVGNTTFVGVPITLKDGTHVGTICGMDRNSYSFSKPEVDLMKSMARLLAYVIELERMAFRDSLTYVYNRNYLDTYFCDQIQENHNSIGFFFFDFDNFKTVNDQYNHHIGDEVLKKVANKIKQNLRPDDILCRVGGDEFLALVIDYGQDDVLTQIAKRIQRSLNEPIETTIGEITMSTSIGISRYPEDGTEINDLVKKADQAMYEVKSKDKNDYMFYKNGSIKGD